MKYTLMKYINLSILALTMLFGGTLLTSNVGAKSYSSKSYSSPSKSYSPPSKSYSPKPKSSALQPNTSSKPKTPGSATQSSAKQKSTVQQKRYEAASKSGKAFKTRDAAVKDFKTKNADKFPSKYTTKPETRPAHIPEKTKDASGQSRDVVYDNSHGGYGYYSGGGPGLGTFIMYDMMSDAIMMNTMMSRQNYYIGDSPQLVYQESRSSVGLVFLFIIMIVIIIGSFIAGFNRI